MGPERVLRTPAALTRTIALALSALLGLGGGAAAAPGGDAGLPRVATPALRVGVVVLGASDRAARHARSRALRAALADGPEGDLLAPAPDALQGALDDAAPELVAGLVALEGADAARAGGDPARAAALATEAALGLAAAQAAGAEATRPLVRAWALRLWAADRLGDGAAARRAIEVLVAIGGGDPAASDPTPPDGVDPELWRRHPRLDAIGNRSTIPLAIDEPDGATIWVDHAPVGAAPRTIYLPEGEHLIATGVGGRGAAAVVDVRWPPPTVALVAPAPLAAGAVALAALARAVREATEATRPAAIGRLLREAGLDAVVVARSARELEVWRAGRGDRPRRLGRAADAAGAAGLLARDGRPDAPLAALMPEPTPAGGGEDDGTPWWIYAGAASAVAMVVGAIVVNQTRDDRQRVHVEL